MGKGIDSFKREVGKNTGKWVSNKLFGDGHSTPYRLNINKEKKKTTNFNEESLFNKSKDFLSKIDNVELDNKEEIANLNKKKEEIIYTQIPNDIENIMNLVNLMLSNIKSYGWEPGNNEEHKNSLSDVCLIKLEQCVIKLKSINEIHQAEYVVKEIENLKKKRKIQKYALWVGIALIFFIAFILYQVGIIK